MKALTDEPDDRKQEGIREVARLGPADDFAASRELCGRLGEEGQAANTCYFHPREV